MAYELRPIENLEMIARDFEEVAARLRGIVAEVRSAGLSEVELQFGYIENYALRRVLDWSFGSEAAAKKFIRQRKLEAAGAALAERRLAEESTQKAAKKRKKPGV